MLHLKILSHFEWQGSQSGVHAPPRVNFRCTWEIKEGIGISDVAFHCLEAPKGNHKMQYESVTCYNWSIRQYVISAVMGRFRVGHACEAVVLGCSVRLQCGDAVRSCSVERLRVGLQCGASVWGCSVGLQCEAVSCGAAVWSGFVWGCSVGQLRVGLQGRSLTNRHFLNQTD